MASFGLLAAMAANPAVVERAREGVAGIDAADPAWLWLAAVLFAAGHAAAGLAWRSALAPVGVRAGRVDATARHCIGSLANAALPAQLGGAVRIALFARICGEHGAWTSAGTAAAVGATRMVWLVLVAAVAAVSGAVPSWSLFALGGGMLLGACAALAARRLTGRRWLADLTGAFRELGRTPRVLAVVIGWGAIAMGARLCAAAAIAAAFGVDSPWLAAFLVIAALDLAAILPLTPGNIGVAAAAVAFALGAHGVSGETAMSAGIALSGIETLTSVTLGIGGCLALAGAHARPLIVRTAALAGCTMIAWAFGATVILPAV